MKALNALAFCLIAILGLTSVVIGATSSEIQSTIYYVKPGGTVDCLEWSTACELQTALSLAEPGDQIWVAAGIYKPTTSGDCEATFTLESGVSIYGGFPDTGGTWNERDWETNITTLSGDIGIDGVITDNSYHVVTGSEVDATAILDGFTIRNGIANGSDPHNYGGGMFNNAGSPTLTNVTFSENSASYGGGMYNHLSSPILNDVNFFENSAVYDGGGMYNVYNSNPTLTNVTFSGNSSEYGGGMYNDNNSSPTLTNVTFSGNSSEYGGGILNDQSSPTLTNVTFSGNSSSIGGGIFNDQSSPTLTNVTFSKNSSVFGGGMSNLDSSSPSMTNVTFSGNTANYVGGGIFNDQSSPTLTNVIVWGNTPDQIYNEDPESIPVVTYSDIQGIYEWEGTGNINDNPLLGPLENNGGFTQTHALGDGSAAIDAGDPNLCPPTDQRGYPRPIDGDRDGVALCDMGAYEYETSLLFLFLPLLVK